MSQPAFYIKSIPPALSIITSQLGPYKKGNAYVVPIDVAFQMFEGVRPYSGLFATLGVPPLPAKGEMTAQTAVKWLRDSKFDVVLVDE